MNDSAAPCINRKICLQIFFPIVSKNKGSCIIPSRRQHAKREGHMELMVSALNTKGGRTTV